MSSRSRSRRALSARPPSSSGIGPVAEPASRPLSAARRSSRAAVPAAIEAARVPAEPRRTISLVGRALRRAAATPARSMPPRGLAPARKNSCVRTSAGENSSVQRAGRRRARPGRPPGSRPRRCPGSSAWATKRMSALSTPIPNALVATMTSMRPARKSSCASDRSSSDIPAWYRPVRTPSPARTLRPELHRFARRGVHDAGRCPSPPAAASSAARLLLAPAAGLHRQGEVGALEAGDQIERIPQAELGGDVGAHVRAWRWP